MGLGFVDLGIVKKGRREALLIISETFILKEGDEEGVSKEGG